MKLRSSADKFMGKHTITDENGSPFMLRIWFGRLRFHRFYRGDHDKDPHDHPWDFWTFPLTAYVEEVTEYSGVLEDWRGDRDLRLFRTSRRVVPAFRWSFRLATHTHKVLGRFNGEIRDDFGFFHRVSAKAANQLPDCFALVWNDRPITTIVWRSAPKRAWGFLKHKDGRYCWEYWKDYVLKGGRNGPCA